MRLPLPLRVVARGTMFGPMFGPMFGLMLGLLPAACAFPVSAQDLNAARNLAATCFTCHGTDGRSSGGIPSSLAGANRAVMLQTLKDFKAGKRPATIMHQHARGYTDEQLELIAGYFSAVKPGQPPALPRP